MDKLITRIDQWLSGKLGLPIGGPTLRVRIKILLGLIKNEPPYRK